MNKSSGRLALIFLNGALVSATGMRGVWSATSGGRVETGLAWIGCSLALALCVGLLVCTYVLDDALAREIRRRKTAESKASDRSELDS